MKGSVRKKGNSWYYRINAAKKDGKRHQIERYAGKTYQEALRTLRNVIDQFEDSGRITNNTNVSVHDYFEFWYHTYAEKHLSENTQRNYRLDIDKYIDPLIGDYKMKKVTPEILQKMFDHIAESTEYKTDGTRLSKHSVEIILSMVKEAFRQAVQPWQIIDNSPALYITLPKYRIGRKTKQDLKIISINQFREMQRLFPEGHPFYVPIMIAFFTGMRRGEVCGLEWKNINLDGGKIDVHQQMLQFGKNDIRIDKPKTASGYRTVEIGQELINVLIKEKSRQSKNRLKYGKYYYDSNFVCTNDNGKPVTPNQIKYFADLAQKKLGFPFNFHSLRHTHATMLLEAGAKPKEVQVRLGHSRISTTLDTYVHLTDKAKRETANLFDQIYKEP